MSKSITDYTLMSSLNTIERWGTIPRLRRSTVASHSFDVCWTIDWLIDKKIPVAVSAEDWRRTMRWAMRHDQIEGLTGDAPSPPKRLGIIKEDVEAFRGYYPLVGELGQPDPKSATLIKLADRMCMLRDAAGEWHIGNRAFEPVVKKCRGLVHKAMHEFEAAWGIDLGGSRNTVVPDYLAECPPLVGISIIVEQELDQ